MKTMKEWEKSDIDNFDDYVLPGDIVGEDIIKHFRNVQIPKTDTEYMLQMGEAQNFIEGKNTYMTFTKELKGWVYRGNCHRGEKETPFEKWLNTFVEEKDIDIREEFKSTKDGVSKIFTYDDVINEIKRTGEKEQEQIKNMIIKIDLHNGDVKDYFRHLSMALIPSREQIQEMEEIYGKSINLEVEYEKKVIRQPLDNPEYKPKGEIIKGYSEEELYNIIENHLKEMLEANDINTDIVNFQIIGSRNKGVANEGSDLDVLIEYNNDCIGEDSLFNMLNDDNDRLIINDIEVDFNPITSSKSGTLEEWLERNYNYNKYETKENPRSFDYMMLDRLRSDCEYFLNKGNGYVGHLYYKDVDEHIEEMKKIYNSFSENEKPEWITLEDIDDYKNKMTELLQEKEEMET